MNSTTAYVKGMTSREEYEKVINLPQERRTNKPGEKNCPFCGGTGQAYGGECVCIKVEKTCPCCDKPAHPGFSDGLCGSSGCEED